MSKAQGPFFVDTRVLTADEYQEAGDFADLFAASVSFSLYSIEPTTYTMSVCFLDRVYAMLFKLTYG